MSTSEPDKSTMIPSLIACSVCCQTRRQRCQRTSLLRSPATLHPQHPRSNSSAMSATRKGFCGNSMRRQTRLETDATASLCVTMTTDLIPVTRQQLVQIPEGRCASSPGVPPHQPGQSYPAKRKDEAYTHLTKGVGPEEWPQRTWQTFTIVLVTSRSCPSSRRGWKTDQLVLTF